MTLQEAVDHATAKLLPVSETAKLDAQLLVGHTCKIEQTKIIAHPEQILSEQQKVLFNSFLDRRALGEPIAYIIGEKEFWSIPIFVNKHVLIPRPETELLVEKALEILKDINCASIIDIGTGSGAIAIAIAKERSDCKITASDISLKALDVARKNSKQQKVSVEFVQSNWYKNLPKYKFDMIVCNPPYVDEDDINLDQYVTKFEPRTAVTSINKGLHDIELVISQAHQFLKTSGYLLIEHGFKQKIDVQDLFQRYRFKRVQTYKDLSGNDRLTIGCQ